MGNATGRLTDLQTVRELLEEVAIFRGIDIIRACADDCGARVLQLHGQIQRGLSAELHDDAGALLALVDVHHVFERQRFKVELIAGIVVGRDRLRIAVDHDGLKASIAQRKGGVTAAVVKFNALANAVRAATEDHDRLFTLLVADRLIVLRIAGIIVGRNRLKFAGARIHEPI